MPLMPYFIKSLGHIKKPHKIQELGMQQRLYKYHGKWTAVDLHKNYWIENEIAGLKIVCIFPDIQTKN